MQINSLEFLNNKESNNKLEKYNHANGILAPAIYNLINSSKTDCITIDKVKQFMNDCDIALNQQSIMPNHWIDVFVDAFTHYRNVYLSITIKHDTYILKFDNASTLELLSKTFLISPIASFSVLKNCNDIFDYNKHELEIIQDNYAYKIITNKKTFGIINILVVDKESRTEVFNINIKSTNKCSKNLSINITDLARERFLYINNVYTFYNLCYLPISIRNYVYAQFTLLLFKG